MIEIKEATKRAQDFIVEFFDKPEKIQVEAFSLSDDKKSWNVTFSFWQKSERVNQLQHILGINGSKIYKTIKVDIESGDVIKMKTSIAENAPETV